MSCNQDCNQGKECVCGIPPSMRIPDPKRHQRISFIKSGFRILAGANICFGNLLVGGALIIVAEILGIVEELV